MLHLGNSAEVDKEKIKSMLREAEKDRLVREALAGGEASTVLQGVGSRLLGMFAKGQSACDCRQGGEQACLANESA